MSSRRKRRTICSPRCFLSAANVARRPAIRSCSECWRHERHARHKFNPLARWTWGDVWHYIDVHQVDHNPLHDRFFPSIGCAPCTRAITLGEPFRAGRWWWEDESAKECGLHVKA